MKNRENLVYNTRKITTFKELFDGSAELYGERTAFCFAEGDEIINITYNEAYEQVKALSAYLRSVVPEGAKVAVSGKNSYRWAITYLAVTCGVGTIIPIDKDLRSDEIAELLKISEASAFVYSPEIAGKAEGLENVLCLSMDDFDGYLAKGRELIENGDRSYETHEINPHETSIILFTSGTTGVSKGVMLSQYNICSNIMGVLCKVRVYPNDVAFSVAPLHHTFECMAGFLSMIYGGAAIAYNSSLRRIQAELKMFRPTIMASVPLIMNTFRNTIIKKYGQIKGGRAVLSIQRAIAGASNDKTKRKIFSIVNDTFGGRMRLIVCGAAPLEPETYRDYERFGIKVYIGYGLTETSPVITCHNDFYRSPYDIGMPLPDTKVRLDNVNDEGIGELVVKGPQVMLGYYKNPEATREVMEDGWFHTGDLARLTERGSYQITGRIKSMIVTHSGKKVFPEELELHIERSRLVKECMVYESHADGSARIAVSVFPDAEEVAAQLAKENLSEGDAGYAERVKELVEGVVASVNKKFPNYKHITKTVIRSREFEKTTTRKIKRNAPDNLNEEA